MTAYRESDQIFQSFYAFFPDMIFSEKIGKDIHSGYSGFSSGRV